MIYVCINNCLFQAFIELKNYVIDYQPLEVPEINVLLVGQIGAGKSSLLNTMNSIFKGEISSRAWAGSSENSVTTSVFIIALLRYHIYQSFIFMCDTYVNKHI